MNTQLDKYIGLQYQAKGRVAPSVDCWGLARLYYKQELDIDLPSFDDSYQVQDEDRVLQELIFQHKESWEKVDLPISGDLVLFKVLGVESHIGIMISSESFIHVRENMDSVKEDLSTPRWNKRIVGYYRYVENKSCITADNKSVVVQGIPHPLRTDRYTIPVPVGTSIACIVAGISKEYKVDDAYKSNLVVMLNGVPVLEHKWGTTFTKENDTIEYRCVPGKGAVLVILAIAIIVAAPYLSSLLLGTTFGAYAATAVGGTVTFLAIAETAITLAGMALLRGASKPPQQSSQSGTSNPGSAERQLMLTGSGNRATPYGAIPLVLGKVRMSPVLGARNYLTFENDIDSYLSMLLVWGFGPLEISPNYKLGEIPISNYTIPNLVTLDRRVEPSGLQLRQFRSIYGKDFDQKTPQQVLSCDGNPEVTVAPGPWTEVSTLQNVDTVTLSIHLPEGLRYVIAQGSNAGSSGGFNVQLEVQKSTDGLSWSALDLINCSEFVSRQVTKYVTETVACNSDSGFCTQQSPVVTTVSEPVAKKDAFTLNRTYNSRYLSDALAVNNDLKFIRIRRLTGDNPSDNSNYQFYFSTVLQAVTFATNIRPEIDPPGCKIAKTAIKIKANDQLNSSIEAFNSVVQSIAPTWNGSAWVDAPTSNPA